MPRIKMSEEERKARHREANRKLRANPEYRKKELEQQRLYNQRPEVQEKNRIFTKKWIARKKASGEWKSILGKYSMSQEPYVENNLWHEIEGYNRLLSEGFSESNRGNRWEIHHRLEEQGFTRQQLIDAEMYYNRPPKELIWMTTSEHATLHHKLRRSQHE